MKKWSTIRWSVCQRPANKVSVGREAHEEWRGKWHDTHILCDHKILKLQKPSLGHFPLSISLSNPSKGKAKMSLNGTFVPENLTWLEKQWVAAYDGRNEVLVTGLLAFVMHEVVYFGRFIPFLICDFIPYFHQWKLQPNKINTGADYWKCLLGVLYCHIFFELPIIFVFHPVGHLIGMRIVEVPFPDWQTMTYQIAIFFVFEDFYHYWAHRALHYGPLYRHIHKQHHEYSAPFGMAAEYAHPLETAILSLGTVAGPLLWVLATGDLHIITMFVWIVLRLFQAIDAHSGYDFPWSLHNIIPFWAGAEHHDYHHYAFVNNFSTSFRWWDYIFGTDTKYRAYRKKQAEEKRLNKEAKKTN